MTVIAAVALDDRVVMGCDTGTDHDGTFVHTVRGKIGVLHAANGERVLIGSAGHASAGRILGRALTVEATPDDPSDTIAADRWAAAVAEAITGILADANPALTVSNPDHGGDIAASILLAWRQHVWLVFAHVAIRPSDRIIAIGSGRDLALGSLHTGADHFVGPEAAVRFAIGLACRLDRGCSVDERGPLVLSTVDDHA